MGSGSSKPKKQPPTPKPSSQPPSRNTGFQEKQIKTPANGAVAPSAPPQPAPSPQRSPAKPSPSQPSTSGNTPMASSSKQTADRHAIMGQLQREKTIMKEVEIPKYGPDDVVLETFYHKNGKEYNVLYRKGKRFYVDSFDAKRNTSGGYTSVPKWSPFPEEWYKQGVLETKTHLSEDELKRARQNQQQVEQRQDDREGHVEHPTKGKLMTYVFEKKRNVHYYFDQKSGMWIRLPLAWELKHELIQNLMAPIEEALPQWTDKMDMLAALRAANYDPNNTIATYMAQSEYGHLSGPHMKSDVKNEEQLIALEKDNKQLKERVNQLQKQLDQEKAAREKAEQDLNQAQERLSNIEADLSVAVAKTESLQREANNKQAEPKGPKIDPQLIRSLRKTAHDLHATHYKSKMEAEKEFENMKRLFQQLALGISRINSQGSNTSKELDEVRELYRREALQRKLLYNKLQELRGNIRVFARCRYDNTVPCALMFPTDQQIVVPGNNKPFHFDKAFNPDSTQEQVFEETKAIVTSCVDGYNVCLLAYGQTGSGKTYTMQGPKSDPGVNVRAVENLLQICAERDNIDYKLKASMVEIYNENIQDLLSPDVKTLDLKAQGNKIVLPGIREMEVKTQEDITTIIGLGEKNRTVASTKMNSTSSRSHLVFMINVEGRDKASTSVSYGTLTLCDLAGSERISKTQAEGQRLVEAAAINKSLTSLGQVFTALRQGQLHVPYRNSKLTHILQPSLGGDAKACLFVNISPAESNIQETVSTLNFGSNARQVQLGQAKKNVKQRGTFGDD